MTDNEVIEVLANGTLRGKGGKFLPGSKPTTAIQTSEQGKALANRRTELAAASARHALAERARAEGLKASPVAAYGLLAGEAYDSARANIMDKPREAVEAGKFALRLASMLPSEDKTASANVAVQVNIDTEALASVMARLSSGAQWTEA